MKTPRNYKKRTYRKPAKKPAMKSFGNSNLNVPRNTVNMGLGFPKKLLTKQKYTAIKQVTSTSLDTTLYSLNGLYDPTVAIGGHQPMYFDVYMSIYQHYTVIGSKVQVRCISHPGNTVPVIISLFQGSTTTVTPTTIESMIEQSKSKTLIVGSQGGVQKTLSLNYSPKKTFGSQGINAANLKGSATANPVEQSYAIIAVTPADKVTSVTMTFEVYLEYIVIYSELKELVSS